MSFSGEVSEELIRVPLKKTCCRKAFLLGLVCAARPGKQTGEWVLYLYHPSVATQAAELFEKSFRATVQLCETVRAGRVTYVLTVLSGAVNAFLESVEQDPSLQPHLGVGFRCAACPGAFLRGAFLGCGTVNDPKKGYHLELLLPTEARADFLARFLERAVGKAGRIRRRDRYGCVYKSNSAISDFLYFAGCSGTSFDVANAFIERDIRNRENRATNCVTHNISRSVDASAKQRSAIERLVETRQIDTLSDELRYTAELRLENPSASLTELALMHEPPISKSGLNRRLSKLMEAAEEK